MRLIFGNLGTTINEKNERSLSTLKKRRRMFSFKIEDDQDSAVETDDEEDKEKDASTWFLSTQKNEMFEL